MSFKLAYGMERFLEINDPGLVPSSLKPRQVCGGMLMCEAMDYREH
jgi:hypothetical protein